MNTKRYIILNKPYGVLSQFTSDIPGQRTLAEFELPEDVYAAGRLDSDSEGLLFLTNDGPLIKKLLDPKNNHQRTYLVQVEGIPTAQVLTQLERGVVIQGYHTLRCHVKLVDGEPDVAPRDPPIRIRRSIPTSWIEIKLIEGKNRQVRRMTASVGYPTLRLIRNAIKNITLESLPIGKWRELQANEIKDLI